MKDEQEIEARAKVLWEGGLKTQSIIRGFEVETDQPKMNFGTNTAPAPMEVFIASMGACLLSSFVWAAFRARVTIDDCNVGIRATALVTENSATASKAEMKLTVWARYEYKKKLETCFNAAKKSCTLTNAVSFPLAIEFNFKDAD